RTSATPLPIMASRTDHAQTVVDAALNDAASHLGTTRDQLHVEQVESREWPDSALGCPQPGVMYAQVVTPGFLIVISAGGKRLEYHTDSRGTVKLCQES